MTRYDESQIDVDIYSELETEMDEMWSFYHDSPIRFGYGGRLTIKQTPP